MKIKVTDKIFFYSFKIIFEKDGDFFITINHNATIIDYDSERILRLFQKHKSINNILSKTSYYTKKELTERINMFIDMKLVKKIGNIHIKQEKITSKHELKFIKKEFAEIFFSTPSKLSVLILFLIIIFSFFLDNKYIPKYQDFFFSKNYLICLLVSFSYSWLSTFRHEFFHFLAARSKNILTTFSLNSRANFIVAETIFQNAYTIKEKNRYRLYLSGIFSDIALFGLWILILLLNDFNLINISSFIYLLIKSFVLIEFLGIIWQLLIFIKTDLYLFFADILDRENLMEDSKKYYLNILKGKKQDKDKFSQIFGILLVIGLCIIITRYIAFDIPIKVKVIKDSFDYLLQVFVSKNINISEIISYFLAMLIQIFEIVAIIFFTIRKKINKDTAE